MAEDNASNPQEIIRVTIDMPAELHERFQLRARLCGAGSVTDYLRRGEAVYGLIVEKALDSGLLSSYTIAEIALRDHTNRIELSPILPFQGS